MTKFLAQKDVFYHGTYNDFIRFKPLSHFGTKYAAQKITRAGMKKTETLNGCVSMSPVPNGTKAHIIPVHLNLKNTYELQDVEASHDKEFYSAALLFHFIKDLKTTRLSRTYDYIVYEPFNKVSWNEVKDELKTDQLYQPDTSNADVIAELIDRQHLFLQRMIHYFESIGFDGFHYTNCFEDPGHISYVPFRPESIIRLDIEPNSQAIASPDIDKKEESCALPIIGDRSLQTKEMDSLKFEKLYRMGSVSEKKFLLTRRRMVLLRPSTFRQTMTEKAYYSKILITDVMPKIAKISNQSRYGYHGLSHTEQVGMFGIDLALSVHQDPLPVILAAGLHDCARVNDDYCEMHGPRCEPIARQFLSENYPKLMPIDVERIVTAVKDHTVGKNAFDLVSACLWDADRIRLSWEMGYAPEFFSTPYGRALAALPVNKQKKYIAEQEKFLIKNNIKTRAQIDYDKAMDAKQNALGTVFKVKEK